MFNPIQLSNGHFIIEITKSKFCPSNSFIAGYYLISFKLINSQTKLFNGKLNNGDSYFSSFEDCNAMCEWLSSIVMMDKLSEQ
jgi:hypothetical protein